MSTVSLINTKSDLGAVKPSAPINTPSGLLCQNRNKDTSKKMANNSHRTGEKKNIHTWMDAFLLPEIKF